MKNLLIVLLFLCAFGAKAQTADWIPSDQAFITAGCTSPYYLYESAQLHMVNDPESKMKVRELWDEMIKTGECFSTKPLKVRVILMEKLATYKNLEPKYGAAGELWKVEAMEKGSTGDYERTGFTFYVGIFEKRFAIFPPGTRGMGA